MCAVLAFTSMLLASGHGDPKSNVPDPDRGLHKTAWLPAQHAAAVTIGTMSPSFTTYSMTTNRRSPATLTAC
jgi:hypothetical protein